jgi:hypothetical protein
VFALWFLMVAVTVPLVVTAVDGVELSTTPSPVKVTLVTVPLPLPAPLGGTAWLGFRVAVADPEV